MQGLAWILLQNTLLALIPALVAIIASYFRRPALAHVMWVLVLLKLVTPPLWQAPVLPAQVAPSPVVQIAALVPSEVVGEISALPVPEMQNAPVALESTAAVGPVVAPAASPPAAARMPLSTSKLLAIAWAVGSGALGFIMLRRIVRFQHLLKETHPVTPAVEHELRDIARRLGLNRMPAARLGPMGVSPLIWFLGGKPLLLLPANMAELLTPAQREAIMAHELAHLKRRDHWVRLLEMAITLLLWWHPLVWMARHGLRAAEEEACDAWVVWLTRDNRGYADALLQLLNQSVTPLPANVSGLGQLGSLKRRLAMILETTPGKMPRRAGWILLALGALLLPLVPVRGQARQPSLQPAEAGTPRPAAAPVAEPAADETTSAAVKGLLEMAVQANKQAAELAAATTRAGGGGGGRGGRGGGGSGGGFTGSASLNDYGGAFGGGGYGPGGYRSANGPANSALNAIRMMGAKAVPPLKESAGSNDAAVRALAVQVLAEIHQNQPADKGSLDTVLQALKDTDKQVRTNAASGLQFYRDQPEAVSAALLPVLADKDATVKIAVIRTLAAINADPKVVTPALTLSLKDEDERVRQMAAEAIGQLNAPRFAPPKTQPAKGDELFQQVNDDLTAMLPDPAADNGRWITITQINRTTDGYWEAEGRTRSDDAIQEMVAKMKASPRFNPAVGPSPASPGASANAPKILSITHDNDGTKFQVRFTYTQARTGER